MSATIYGYPAREDIVAGKTYTVTMPQGMSDKRFRDAVDLVKGIGERPGSSAVFDEVSKTWTVVLSPTAKSAVDDLRLAEAKYDADVVEQADPFAGIPNADDSENGEFSPVKVTSSGAREYGIIERVGQAEYYLREAARAGLPLPSYVTIGAHDHGAWRSSQIGVQLGSRGQVRDWAAHFGTVVNYDEDGAARTTLAADGHHDVMAYCGAGDKS